ncbi:Hexadecenal dehydrogenase [Microbotryomycetes sp. JL221]|nr:Hexadecenal dehydrogenase [Microbotryomycetes sp. JL221]
MSSAAASHKDTPLDQIPKYLDELRKTFFSHKTRDIKWRKHQIKQLGFMVQDNEQLFKDAIQADLGRHGAETVLSELNPMKAEINEAYAHVEKWAKPTKVKTTATWLISSPTVTPQPKGVALVIGTWNFPVTLTLGPLLGAISAGCPAVLKPSEVAANTAAVMAQLLPKYLDPTAYKCVTGGVETSTALLKLNWDHIFYTGSGSIGRIVARAASEFLTPVTLELGGKSPSIVFDDADVKVAGRRIAWGKFTNSGQICIAPDYILCSKKMQPKLIASIRDALKEFNAPSKESGQGLPLVQNPQFPKIVSQNHYKRLTKILDATKGEIVIGGERDDATNKLEPTVVTGVGFDDSLMDNEIFGSLLPVITMETKEEMSEFINRGDEPLAIYVFTQNKKNAQYIFDHTRSGGFVQNDVLVHFLIPGLPFGGTGKSGVGNYHGKYSFDVFSHQRASAAVPTWADFLLASRYPPYTAGKLRMLMLMTGETIRKEPSSLRKLFKTIATIAAVLALIKRFA